MAAPSTPWVTGEEHGFPRPFGNYLLLAAFAQGGMGELFLAMHGGIAGAFRLCVLKKLRPDLTNDREYVSRFIDEARVVVHLNHANISHVFDVGRVDGHYYLAMDYVSGVSVKRLMSHAIQVKATLPEALAIFIVRGMLEALDCAHRHAHPITGEALHVVHRDVSPQNVLVSWEGEVKLIDFGLALSAMKHERTATGAVMGKVAYMSPEQARGDDVDPSCDQFATAVMLYEMLAGERYYGDLTHHAIWSIAGKGSFPPPGWSKVGPELRVILERALQHDKDKRYESCGDLRDALGAYMASHHPHTSERSLRELLDGWFKSYRAQERELLARFAGVTGAAVREAVKDTETSVESLVFAPLSRPAFALPNTHADRVADPQSDSTTLPNPSITLPISPRAHEATERVPRVEAPARSALVPAAAVAAAVFIVVVVVMVAIRHEAAPAARVVPVNAAALAPPPTPSTTPSATPAPTPMTPSDATAPAGDDARLDAKAARRPTPPRPSASRVDERPPAAPVAEVSREAARARDRIGALQRSACTQPCKETVMVTFEARPAVVELEGFQRNVEKCLQACGSD